jgi:hypothetical protein
MFDRIAALEGAAFSEMVELFLGYLWPRDIQSLFCSLFSFAYVYECERESKREKERERE